MKTITKTLTEPYCKICRLEAKTHYGIRMHKYRVHKIGKRL